MKPPLKLLLMALLVGSCASQPSRTTNTHSQTLPDLAARKAFLGNYYRLPTEVEDLHFQVNYQDNSGGGVPGPSDWDIRVVARVKPEAVQGWTGQLKASSKPLPAAWLAELVDWELSENPEYFGDEREMLIIDREPGIVARRSTTMP